MIGPRLKPVIPLGDRTDPVTKQERCQLEVELVLGRGGTLYAS